MNRAKSHSKGYPGVTFQNDPATGAEESMPLGDAKSHNSFVSTVQWASEGVMLHYPNGRKAPHRFASVQLGVYPPNNGLKS